MCERNLLFFLWNKVLLRNFWKGFREKDIEIFHQNLPFQRKMRKELLNLLKTFYPQSKANNLQKITRESWALMLFNPSKIGKQVKIRADTKIGVEFWEANPRKQAENKIYLAEFNILANLIFSSEIWLFIQKKYSSCFWRLN